MAFLATGAAIALRAAITPVLGNRIPFLTFFPAVTVASWYGGFWPGVLCTLLSTTLVAFFFLEPAYSMTIASSGDVLALGIFAATGTLIAVLNETLHRQRAVAERATQDAAAANRAKDEFVSMVSHELRTPLTSVLGWARLLRVRAGDPAAFERGLDAIERNAMSQARIIDDLFDVSRIVFGELRLELQPVDAADVVHSAVEAARPSAEAKGIALEVQVGGATATSADPNRLQQIVGNLITNALKFSERGGRVDVRLERRGPELVLQVTDQGCGIAPEFLPHVFERFRQANSSTTRPHAGLGLGLAIVKDLVEMHGGRIEARSEGVGRGATFTVVLPAREPSS